MAGHGVRPAENVVRHRLRERLQTWIVDLKESMNRKATLAYRPVAIHGGPVGNVCASAKFSCRNNLKQKVANLRIFDALPPQPRHALRELRRCKAVHLDAWRLKPPPTATTIAAHIGFEGPDALRGTQALRIAMVQDNRRIERDDVIKNRLAPKRKPRRHRAHGRPDCPYALCGHREQESLDRFNRHTAGEEGVKPLGG